MSLDIKQFRDHIVRPTLVKMGLYSKAAERLLIGTALAESHLVYIQQFGNAPAMGVYQMEGATHDDIWHNYLEYRDDLAARVAGFMMTEMPDTDQLRGNLYYATAMCRVHYLRVREALPHENDLEGLARYWKAHYNTALGKGTVHGFMEKAKEIITL